VVGDHLLGEEVIFPEPLRPDRPKKYRIVDYCTSALHTRLRTRMGVPEQFQRRKLKTDFSHTISIAFIACFRINSTMMLTRR
jgi:hypothetical protein